MRRPKTFTLATTTGTNPTREEVLALFNRTAEVIELRVQTPCSSIEVLEDYARSVARSGDLALIATRRADWHKPFVARTNPYKFRSYEWSRRVERDMRERAEYPRVNIVEATVYQSIENADNQLWLARHGRYGKPKVRQRRAQPNRPLHERLVDQRSVLWMARELPGVAEITLLPASTNSQRGTYPLTISIATTEGLVDVCRAIRLLGDGKRPYEATLQTLVEAGKERNLTENEVMRAHGTRRIKPYKLLWEQVCKAKGYGDPAVPILPCVCELGKRPSPRTLGEAARQMVEHISAPEVHQAACYERAIDVLTCFPDFWLAHNRLIDKIGERHSLIASYHRELAEVRKQMEG